jgi:hypothetical protein
MSAARWHSPFSDLPYHHGKGGQRPGGTSRLLDFDACNGSTAQANRGFGPQTKAAGTADNCPVIDVTTLSAALYTSLGLCPNSNDYTSTTSKVGQFFCNDHTHFEKAGGLQIAQMVGKALKDQGIGLAAYLAN